MAALGQTYPPPGSGRSVYENAPVYQGGADFKNSVVLSTRELGAMSRHATSQLPRQDEATRKANLRTMSQSRYKNWGNTLEALREKKKRDRVSKLARAEEAQRRVDEQEAEYQEQQRREAIDRANRLLFKENDRVKSFQSSMLLSTVLQERQGQILDHRRRQAQDKAMDKMWLDMQKDNIAKLQAREAREEQMRKTKGLDLAASQMEQLQQHRERERQQRLEQVRIGEHNKKVAQEALAEQKEMDRLRRERQRTNNKEYMRANLEQRKIKAEKARLEALEDAKIAEFAADKERRIALRKAAEEERFRAKQARFDKMLQAQHDHLKDLRLQEASRLERDVEEIKQREDNKFAMEKQKRIEQREMLDKARTLQRARKKAERERQQLEDKVVADEWERRRLEMEEMERMDEAERRRQALELQNHRRQHRDEKYARTKAAKEKALEAARRHHRRLEEDEQQFREYADTKIREYAAKGRTVVPMKLDIARVERNRRRLAEH